MSEPVRRRGVLGISGWMLFACLFLPTLRVCGDPVMPIEFPPTYGVYLCGVLVAVIGFSALRRTRRTVFVAMQTVYLASIFTFGAIAVGQLDELAGVVAGLVLLVVLVLVVRDMMKVDWGERAVAIGCFVHAMVAAGWSAMLAFDRDGMWGAQVSLGASSLMLFAAGGYVVHAMKEPRSHDEPGALPEARMV